MQRVLQGGWQGYAKPLVTDYVDRLAAEIGSAARRGARARARRSGCRCRCASTGRRCSTTRTPRPRAHRRWSRDERRTRHRRRRLGPGAHAPPTATASASAWPARCPSDRPRALRLGHAGGAAAAHRRWPTLVRAPPAAAARRHRRRRGRASAAATSRRRSRCAGATNSATWPSASTAWPHSLHGMLDAKRALLLAISHELRSPLTRARAERRAGGRGRAPRRAAARPGRDARPDHRPAGKRAPGQPATPRCRPKPWTCAALVRELVATQFARADARRCSSTTASARVRADPTRVRLLLRNLIDNALRHSAGAPQPPRGVAAARSPTGRCLERARLRPRRGRGAAGAPGRALLPRRQRTPARHRRRRAGPVPVPLVARRMAARCASAAPSRGSRSPRRGRSRADDPGPRKGIEGEPGQYGVCHGHPRRLVSHAPVTALKLAKPAAPRPPPPR